MGEYDKVILQGPFMLFIINKMDYRKHNRKLQIYIYSMKSLNLALLII